MKNKSSADQGKGEGREEVAPQEKVCAQVWVIKVGKHVRGQACWETQAGWMMEALF